MRLGGVLCDFMQCKCELVCVRETAPPHPPLYAHTHTHTHTELFPQRICATDAAKLQMSTFSKKLILHTSSIIAECGSAVTLSPCR